MAKSLLLMMAVGLLAVSCLLAVDAGVEFGSDLGWIPAVRSGGCDGAMGECGLDGEFEMDSEINRRILATQRYISYGALNKNTVPCSRRGASYYNCRPGASSNPYRRGCSAITRCRSYFQPLVLILNTNQEALA
ncbi:hypothetical protein V2J09_023551 [Rumex salicifolius]